MTPQPSGAPPWPVFLHDAGHTGRSANSGPQGYATRWALRLGDYVRSSPVIGEDGTIYVGSWDYHLHAIRPDGSVSCVATRRGLKASIHNGSSWRA